MRQIKSFDIDWIEISTLDMDKVLTTEDKNEINKILANRGTRENPGTEINLAGRARPLEEHYSDCVVGKCAEYISQERFKIEFIGPHLKNVLKKHPKYETLARQGFMYNDFYSRTINKIFEVKCWGSKYARNPQSNGFKMVREAANDGWLVADFLIVFEKNWIRDKGATKIRPIGIYQI